MATSSIPAAVDYLVATITAMPAFAPPVVVNDGWPVLRGDKGITIGISPDDDVTDNDQVHAELGAQAEWEPVAIPCLLWAVSVSGNPAKDARDAAFVMFNAVDSHMRTTAGRTLGGAVKSGAAKVAGVRLTQTGTADAAGTGRVAKIRFDIRYQSRSTA